MAQDSGGTVHLLDVVPMVPAIGEPAVSAAMHSCEEDKAIEELKKIAHKHLKGLKCELHTRFAALKGLAKAINQVAVGVDAALIVLKTHGRHGFAHLVLGSVAEYLRPLRKLTSTLAKSIRCSSKLFESPS